MNNRLTGSKFIATYVSKRYYRSERHGSATCYITMSTRPEQNSGRGATMSDLGSHHFEMIYDGLKHEFGQKAATKFAQFVYDMEVLSATAFLNAFYGFYESDFEWTPRKHHAMDDVDFPEGDKERLAVGLATVGNMFASSRGDATESIRYQFLRNHEKEIDFWRKKNDKVLNNGDIWRDWYR